MPGGGKRSSLLRCKRMTTAKSFIVQFPKFRTRDNIPLTSYENLTIILKADGTLASQGELKKTTSLYE